jgi:ketosteroid isomerase-like protein
VYKAMVRALVRHGIGRLNDGDPTFLLRLAAPDVQIVFPGDNSWAAMHRPVMRSRHPHPTHSGLEECRAFADRFVTEGLRLVIEDMLVNGWPWNTRVAVRAHDFIAGDDASDANNGDVYNGDFYNGDVYNNRLVAFLEIRWGRLYRWEDYEDTERVAARDRDTLLRRLEE